MASSLVRSFLAKAKAPGATADNESRLEEVLRRQLAVAAEAWPGVVLPEDEVVALWAERVADTATDLEAAVEALRAADLYIACGCGRADPMALQAFEDRYFQNLGGVLSRVAPSASDVSEVTQILREKLFAPRSDDRPRIVDMAGHGDLGGLIRVAAVRIALNLRRTEQRLERVADRAELAVLAPLDDPEIIAIREQHRGLFKDALEHAVGELTPRDRHVLRMQLLDGLSIDEIGRAHDVHRATAARWLERIRADLRTETLRRLRTLLGSSGGELDSLIRILDSRLEISFHRLLRTASVKRPQKP